MAPTHRYDLINNSDEAKDEPQTPIIVSTIPAWWKIVFAMLLAGSVGFGAAFGAVVGSSYLNSNDTAAAATTVSPSSSISADRLIATSSSTSADLPLSTSTSLDVVEGGDNDSDDLIGKILECGHSPSEARAAGCVYDVMMQDWVPEPCYDSSLTEKYLAKGNYTWYSDMDGNTMTDEEMAKGEHDVAYMAADYHKAHCIFSWEKLIRALRNNRAISQELLSYDHVLHCRMQTLKDDLHMDMDKRGSGGIGVAAPTNYAKCALYRTWRHDFIPDKHSSIDK